MDNKLNKLIKLQNMDTENMIKNITSNITSDEINKALFFINSNPLYLQKKSNNGYEYLQYDDDHKRIEIFDGFHTMNEIYEHRMILYIAMVTLLKNKNNFECYWARAHSDGTMFGIEGKKMIILQVNNLDTGEQISYHLHQKYIPLLQSAKIKEVPRSDEFDGHTPNDVLDRVCKWILNYNDYNTLSGGESWNLLK